MPTPCRTDRRKAKMERNKRRYWLYVQACLFNNRRPKSKRAFLKYGGAHAGPKYAERVRCVVRSIAGLRRAETECPERAALATKCRRALA